VSALLLGPAGSGKTQQMIERIQGVKSDDPLAPVLVLVPNQIQAIAFRHRLAVSGGALGVDVLTFYGLYADILDRAGQPIPALLDPTQVRLLRSIVDALCQQGVLRHYASLRKRPGFVLALRNAIQEFKRARIFPVELSHAVRDFGPRLEELAAVYSAYQDWLQRHGWADQEGRGWLAALAVEQHPAIGSDLRLLAAVGFDEFNPTQLGVLSIMARRAGETLIALTGDGSTGAAASLLRPALHRFERARQALAALDLPVEGLASKSFLAPAISHIEAHLFRPQSQPYSGQPGNVEFIEAQNRSIEVRAALRWVKARLLRDHLSLGDVAVLARDLEPYRPFLEEVAAEFGLPLQIAGGIPLAKNPAVIALLSLLSLPAKNWPRRPLVEAWRSPYFNWASLGIAPSDATSLDAVSRQGRVIAGLDQWTEAFHLLDIQQPVEMEDEAEFDAIAPFTRELRGKFEAFCALLSPPARAAVHVYAAFVEDLIGEDTALARRFPFQAAPQGQEGLSVVAQARLCPDTAGRDIAALRSFKDVLRGLVLAEAALRSPATSYAEFDEELRRAVEGATYAPRIFSDEMEAAGILAASALNARGLTFQAAVVMGLSEGEFPRPECEDPFLSEAERQTLRQRGIPLEPRLRGDEGAFFYQAATRARQRLLFTRPYLADDGQPWEASPYWNMVHHLSGKPPIRRIRPEDAIAPEEAASIVERPIDPVRLQAGLAILQARLSHAGGSAYNGGLEDLVPAMAARYGDSFGWSPSKLEAYGTCPFYFYISYTLELEAPLQPQEGYDVRMLGSMLHKILEKTYAQAENSGDVNECLAHMHSIASQVFAAAPAEYGFRPTPMWAQQQQELMHTLHKTILALAEESQGFAPRYYELQFGMGNPSLVLHTEIGDIRLHGYIDRVDASTDGRLRVIDYKSSGELISARHLQEGRRLQLPLYALAVRDALGLGQVAGGFYWHIQKAEASNLKLENYEDGIEAACQTAASHVIRDVHAIRSGQFKPRPPADGCPNYCPAASFCWQYQPKGY
jgi:ATP-dependent helicase/nuclease subunit B